MKDRILDRIIRFDKLLGLTAIVIALVAAFFSVYGISTLFAGAFIATAIMASALEVGKLVSVTFLYRYWEKMQGFLKTYLAIATIVLMLITSLGIFGYLSAAYQKSSLEFKATQEKIVMIESQIPFYTNLISQSEKRIRTLSDARVVQEARLSEAMTNTFLSRNPLQLKQLQEQTIALINQADLDMRTESGQIRTNQMKIMSINEEVNTMKFEGAGKKDIQTFQFVAEQFGTTLDKVAKWFIFTLIFVFDPLALALILAYNVVVFRRDKLDPQPEPPRKIVEIKPQPKLSEELISPEKPETSSIITSPIEPQKQEIVADNVEQNAIVSSPIEDTSKSESSTTNINDPFYRQMFKL